MDSFLERLQKVFFFGVVVPIIVIWTLIKSLLRLIVKFLVEVTQNAYGKLVAAAGTALVVYLVYIFWR